MVLGTIPKAFSQVTTSQMCNFPSGDFPNEHLRLGLVFWGAVGCNDGPSAAARTSEGAERCI